MFIYEFKVVKSPFVQVVIAYVPRWQVMWLCWKQLSCHKETAWSVLVIIIIIISNTNWL